MTEEEFRRLVLSFPEAREDAHMGHPDFRVGGKIFATLGFPGDGRGMVKLTPEQRKAFIRDEPEVFQPCNGAWGRRGATYVCLAEVTEVVMLRALVAAWRNTAPKRLSQELEDE